MRETRSVERVMTNGERAAVDDERVTAGEMTDESHPVLHSSFAVRRSPLVVRRSSFLFVLAACAALCACAARARAQASPSPAPTPEKVRPKGSITGRVVGEDGQPMNAVRVFALAKRGIGYESRGSAVTGPDGSFKLENLEAAPYTLSAYAPGHFDAAYLEYERGERPFYRPGDTVSIRVLRGGVITGRVTDARGEPAAGARVNLVRVRTLDGSPVREVNLFMRSLERTTDDRGVYRSYGLLPGVYIVSAGGRFSMAVLGVLGHTEQAPTFYPSTTRDAATEVTVRAGEEVGSVDVRLRGDRGHAISGTVAGVTDATHAEYGSQVMLISADSTEYVARTYFYGRSESDSFSFDGLPDGDYDLVAERFKTNAWERVASSSRRVQVRGADVTGLKVTFTPLGSVAGRVIFDAPPTDGKPLDAKAADAKTLDAKTAEAKTPTDEAKTSAEDSSAAAQSQCKGSADALRFGAVVVLRREPEGAAAAQPRPANEPTTLEAAPDEQGEFRFTGVAAGTYRIDFKLSEGYFVTAVRRGATSAPAARTQQPQPAPRANTPSTRDTAATTAARDTPDAGASVVRLRQGEQLSGIVVAASYGAASVAGRVSFPECEGCSPERVTLYLVPQERERADDVMRYAEASLERKGREAEFSFDSVAPGRYALVALPEAARPTRRDARPPFTNEDTRARIRREAEARGTPLTLAPCRRAEGQTLVYSPPSAPAPARR